MVLSFVFAPEQEFSWSVKRIITTFLDKLLTAILIFSNFSALSGCSLVLLHPVVTPLSRTDHLASLFNHFGDFFFSFHFVRKKFNAFTRHFMGALAASGYKSCRHSVIYSFPLESLIQLKREKSAVCVSINACSL